MVTNRRILGIVAAALAALVVQPVAGASGTGMPPGAAHARVVDRAEDCDPRTPEAIGTSPTGSGQTVSLDALVLLDGVARADAQSIVAKAASSWSPLKIALVPTYRRVTFAPDQGTTARASATRLLALAKEAVGGVRPEGTDVVYVLTAKDLYLPTQDVSGYADCIGGIRYPGRAFALGEANNEETNMAGVRFYIDAAAKVASHEIGHLLGARHEHANCAEGISAQDVTNREPSACTLMTNFLDFQSLNFGTLEALVVRAHAERYAAP